LVVGCQKGPTTTGANDVRFALSAQVTGTASAVLHVIVSYVLDSAQVATPPLVDTRVNAGTGTAQVPLTIDLGPCLVDPRRAGDGPSCELTVTVTLEQNGTVVDSVTIPTITATPGQTVQATTTVQPIGAVRVRPTSATIAVGGTVQLVDTVFSPTEAVVTGVAVTWTSSNPQVARVDTSGLVTGVGAGTTHVTVTAGSAKDSATIVVTGSVTGGLALGVPSVQFSAPSGSSIPLNAIIAVTSTDTGQVSGLTSSITYGAGQPTGWLLANVSDSSFSAPSVAKPRKGIRHQTSSVTTPGILDVVPSTTSLAAGTYTATVTVTGGGGQGVQLPVTYIISAGAGAIVITPDTVTFQEYGGGTILPSAVTVVGSTTGLTITGYNWIGLASNYLNAIVTGGDTISISPTTTNLPLQDLQAFVHVRDTNGDTGSVFVDLNVTATFSKLVAGGGYTCGLTTGSTVYCWGANYIGQLGVGSGAGQYAIPMPVAIPNAGDNGTPVIDITGGYAHACALMSNNAVWCWGYNVDGETGTGILGDTLFSPVQISTLQAAQVSGGGYHTCAIEYPTVAPYGGTLACWGNNNDGQLGTGSTGASQDVPVNTGQTFVSVSSGFQHACAVLDSNAPIVYCWGSNQYGQIGIDSLGSTYPAPHAVGAYASVSAGGYHTCAIATAGGAFCWGDNGYGELGMGTVGGAVVYAPVAVTGPALASIVAGYLHTCGLDSNGAAYCWGYDSAGALGNGQATGTTGTPTAVVGGLVFASIAPSVAGYHTCGITTASVAYCWGYDAYGQLGINSTQNTAIPLQVSGQPAAPGVYPVGSRVVRRPTPKATPKARRPARK
jgi:hypothetical protein